MSAAISASCRAAAVGVGDVVGVDLHEVAVEAAGAHIEKRGSLGDLGAEGRAGRRSAGRSSWAASGLLRHRTGLLVAVLGRAGSRRPRSGCALVVALVVGLADRVGADRGTPNRWLASGSRVWWQLTHPGRVEGALDDVLVGQVDVVEQRDVAPEEAAAQQESATSSAWPRWRLVPFEGWRSHSAPLERMPAIGWPESHATLCQPSGGASAPGSAAAAVPPHTCDRRGRWRSRSRR
jgi:hypothetical protein